MRTVHNVRQNHSFTFCTELELLFINKETLLPYMASIELPLKPSYWIPIVISKNEPLYKGDLVLDSIVGGLTVLNGHKSVYRRYLYKVYAVENSVPKSIVDNAFSNKIPTSLHNFEVGAFHTNDDSRLVKLKPRTEESFVTFKLLESKERIGFLCVHYP